MAKGKRTAGVACPPPTGLRLKLSLLLAHHRLDDEEHVIRVRLGGGCLPLCARCTGTYAAFALWLLANYLLLGWGSRDPYQAIWVKAVVVLLALPFAAQWSWQTLGKRRFSAYTRLWTGALAGIALASVIWAREMDLSLAALGLIVYILIVRLASGYRGRG